MTKMNKDYGFRPDIITPDHYTLLGGQAPFNVLQPDGQWDIYLPPFEPQNIGFETYNCTAFGTTNAIEVLMMKVINSITNNSDRAVGILAGTGPMGNTPHVVAEAIRKNGLIPEFRLPMTGPTSIEEYYQPNPLPAELLEIGAGWKIQFDFLHDWVFSTSDLVKQTVENKIKLMQRALTSSPLCISVDAWNEQDGIYIQNGPDNHWTLCYGWTDKGWKVFDSYDNSHKIYSFDADIMFAKRYVITKKNTGMPTTQAPLNFFRWLIALIKKMLNL